MALFVRTLFLPHLKSASERNDVALGHKSGIRKDKFVEVPQIVWGLNNQKIAFARSCLTARLLNRTLLMPSLSASLFYKEVDLLEPISFDKVFNFERFNAMCGGFVRLGKYSDSSSGNSNAFELKKGSGRKWTKERDFDQLEEHRNGPNDDHEVIRIVGKNPFLWHDHWAVKDYAKVLECMVLVDKISAEADRVVSKIKEIGTALNLVDPKTGNVPFVAVHMRVERDWMIHCKNMEKKLNITQICSSKEKIMERVGNIEGLENPTLVYLAVGDKLLEDASILSGWKDGLVPFEKKKLGVFEAFQKYPYLIQSAIDYEVCLRSDVFVGNSFSTFSSIVVLERTQKMLRSGFTGSCNGDAKWPSFAYNVPGESNGPRRWATKMTDPTLKAVSYGSNNISC